MTDDELLGRVLRRYLESDEYRELCPSYSEVSPPALCLDGWVRMEPDEYEAATRVRRHTE
jgi:hypothetical protein